MEFTEPIKATTSRFDVAAAAGAAEAAVELMAEVALGGRGTIVNLLRVLRGVRDFYKRE